MLGSVRNRFKDYINKCDEVLVSEDIQEAERLQTKITGIFGGMIPKLDEGLDEWYCEGDNVDYLCNIEVLRGKLDIHLAAKGEYLVVNSTKVDRSINLNNTLKDSGNSTNTNTNTLTNTVDIKAELSKVREQIEADEVLGDDDKEEINEKLDEIEAVMGEDPTNNEKWKKLKGVVNWVTTKGYKIGQMLMPLITKALFPE